MTQKASDHPANRAAKDRKNARARERRAAAKAERERVLELARKAGVPTVGDPPADRLGGPVPCPRCGKMMPEHYGQPGVAMARDGSGTLICSDCGTREALGDFANVVPIKPAPIKVSAWLAERGSHEIYESDKVAADFLARTGHKAPWVPATARAVKAAIANDPRGGTLNAPDDMRVIGGYEMASACAWEFARYRSHCMGRGFLFRDCIAALEKAGQ